MNKMWGTNSKSAPKVCFQKVRIYTTGQRSEEVKVPDSGRWALFKVKLHF